MATVGDDCYFFFTSSCSKGPSCPFRHVEAAKACKIICQHWQRGGCFRPMCMFRHSDFKLQVDISEVPCYWESQPIGCRKPNCAYKHVKPRPANTSSSIVTTDAGIAANPSQTVTTASPAVKPVIIQAGESEDSNASPEKRPPQTETGADNSEKELRENKSGEGSKPEEVAKKEDEDTDKPPAEPVKKKIKKKIVKTKAAAKTTTPKTKKVVKKVPVKKKKVPEAVVKKKKQVVKKEKLKSPVPPVRRKTVKERLGIIPAGIQGGGSVSDDSGSDSDDSIENIKVMTVEEILRQKALESMMRKKAAEGKSAAPQPPLTKIKTVQKTVKAAPKRKVSPPSSSSEEEEESEESSSSSSSDDSSESESSSSSDNPDVRRVIVDVESEKAARKRAKASLLKKRSPQLLALQSQERLKGGGVKKAKTLKQAQSAALQKKKIGKKRLINMGMDSVTQVHPSQKPLSVRERLGLPVKESKLKVPGDGDKVPLMSLKVARVVGEGAGSPRKTVIASEMDKESMGESDSSDGLEGIKVKTLEEIRLEKMKKLAARENSGDKGLSPIRQRLGLPKTEEEGDTEKEGRQVLLVTEPASQSVGDSAPSQEVPKKVRKRPWRSQKAWQPEAAEETEDQRTAVVTSLIRTAGDNFEAELDQYKQDRGLDESPFESLKRRALLKKVQTAKARKLEGALSSGGDAKGEMQSPGRNIVEDVQEEAFERKGDGVIAEAEVSSKKHKHKRKSKHHKKSKTERQIYMPPALKNSVSFKESRASPESVPASVSEATNPAPTQTVKVPPMRRGHHPIAAAWAAGLSLSAKGTGRRPPEAVPTPYSEPIQTSQKVQIAPRENKTVPSSEPSGLTIKSFSEIMAEKRRRRLEQQAQKEKRGVTTKSMPASTAISWAEGEQSNSPVREDNRPRVPITPIVFSPDKPKAETSRSQAQLDPVSNVGSFNTHIPPNLGQIEPVTATAKVAVSAKEHWNSSEPVAKVGRISSSVGESRTKSQKKLFKKKSKSDLGSTMSGQNSGRLCNTAAQEESPSLSHTPPSLPAFSLGDSKSAPPSSTSPSLSSIESSLSGRGTVSVSQNVSSVQSSGTSLRSPLVGVTDKHKSPVEEADTSQKKGRLSIDDEFSFLDEDFTPSGDVLVGDVEPIDDLLQDIDDLLA